MTASQRVVLATGNPHKVVEISSVLPRGIELVPQTELGIPSPEETGLTFVENAIIKARNAAALSGLPALADDSGLEVDYLAGEPGIYSSRYAGEDATDEDNNDKLIAALDGVPRELRSARFHCVIVYMKHAGDPAPIIASGRWEGEILPARQGTNGFGYDPLFFIPSAGLSVAQLDDDVKHRSSHRGQALAKLHSLLEQ